MSSVSRIFDVKASPDRVVPYLADFSHAEQWDPGTVSCTPNFSGPVAVGASWHNTSKLFGVSTELTYTLEALSGSRIVLVGRNKTATSTETIEVNPAPDGTGGSHIVYRNTTVFNGFAKLADPLVRLLFERLGGEVEANLIKVLDALAA